MLHMCGLFEDPWHKNSSPNERIPTFVTALTFALACHKPGNYFTEITGKAYHFGHYGPLLEFVAKIQSEKNDSSEISGKIHIDLAENDPTDMRCIVFTS